MSGGPRIALLGLAGLAAATLLGLAAHLVTRETIALPATSLSAGDSLAPAAPTARPRATAPQRDRAADTTAATTRPAATTGEDSSGDDRSGRQRGGSGDDGGSGSSGSTSTGSSSGSGSGSDDSGSDDSGRGRGRGRGGDD